MSQKSRSLQESESLNKLIDTISYTKGMHKYYLVGMFLEAVKNNGIIPYEYNYDSHISYPKCPNCKSIMIKKISAASRISGAMTLGIFSSNIGKTMYCKKCGYKW